jgi:hypothetical protein
MVLRGGEAYSEVGGVDKMIVLEGEEFRSSCLLDWGLTNMV